MKLNRRKQEKVRFYTSQTKTFGLEIIKYSKTAEEIEAIQEK